MTGVRGVTGVGVAGTCEGVRGVRGVMGGWWAEGGIAAAEKEGYDQDDWVVSPSLGW